MARTPRKKPATPATLRSPVFDQSGALTREFSRAVHQYLLIERTKLARADIALLFGSGAGSDAIAREGAKLYRAGFVDRLVVSGGVAASPSETEAAMMRRVLIESGVPDSAILVENRAGNTEENVRFTRALLRHHGLFPSTRSIIGVGNVAAGRRFLMTLARRWPEAFSMFVGANAFPVRPRDWGRDPDFRAKALEEWAKIMPYKGKDWLREVDLAAINKTARHMPQPGRNP